MSCQLKPGVLGVRNIWNTRGSVTRVGDMLTHQTFFYTRNNSPTASHFRLKWINNIANSIFLFCAVLNYLVLLWTEEILPKLQNPHQVQKLELFQFGFIGWACLKLVIKFNVCLNWMNPVLLKSCHLENYSEWLIWWKCNSSWSFPLSSSRRLDGVDPVHEWVLCVCLHHTPPCTLFLCIVWLKTFRGISIPAALQGSCDRHPQTS